MKLAWLRTKSERAMNQKIAQKVRKPLALGTCNSSVGDEARKASQSPLRARRNSRRSRSRQPLFT